MSIKILELHTSSKRPKQLVMNYMIYWMNSGSYCYLDKLTDYFDTDGKVKIKKEPPWFHGQNHYFNTLKYFDAKEIGEIKGNLTFKKYKDLFPELYV